jgi:hypothetical protein
MGVRDLVVLLGEPHRRGRLDRKPQKDVLTGHDWNQMTGGARGMVNGSGSWEYAQMHAKTHETMVPGA